MAEARQAHRAREVVRGGAGADDFDQPQPLLGEAEVVSRLAGLEQPVTLLLPTDDWTRIEHRRGSEADGSPSSLSTKSARGSATFEAERAWPSVALTVTKTPPYLDKRVRVRADRKIVKVSQGSGGDAVDVAQSAAGRPCGAPRMLGRITEAPLGLAGGRACWSSTK